MPGRPGGPARGSKASMDGVRHGVMRALRLTGHHGRVRVLVVEDNQVVAGAVAEGLRDQGMAVDVAPDGAIGLEKAELTAYDVIVLDPDLPAVHGDEVCARLACARAGARVLMLTAAGAAEERVDGLNLGADDYLAKPFHFPELVARVVALSRRAPSTPPVLHRGGLTLDRARRRAGRAGRPVPLTRKELGVLEVLMVADGPVVSAEQLLEQAWDEFADGAGAARRRPGTRGDPADHGRIAGPPQRGGGQRQHADRLSTAITPGAGPAARGRHP
jgi:DNA-binding response OmpR family regulator